MGLTRLCFLGLRGLVLFLFLFVFLLLFGLLFSGGSALGFWIDIEQWLSDIQTVALANMELEYFASMGTFDFNSDLIGFDIDNGLVLVDPLSFL